MENNLFDVKVSENDGTVASLVLKNDSDHMNWCSGMMGWGSIRLNSDFPLLDENGVRSVVGIKSPTCVLLSQENGGCRAVYEDEDFRITVERSFDESGFLNERYTVKNLRDADMFLEQGDIGIALPFNDIYTYADDCMINRCNTHIWCGGSTSYISAVKMGESDTNLGLVLTEGAFASYSMCNADIRCCRGVFVMDCEHLELLPGEEYAWNWKLFPFKDRAEFEKTIAQYRHMIRISAESYTVFRGESVRCRIHMNFKPERLSVRFDGKEIAATEREGEYAIDYTPERFGDIRLTVEADDIHTYAEFYCSETPDELIKKRLYFIAQKQQYQRKESALYGAYLAYDNVKKYPIFSSVTRDHNACRERTGMALFMCRYLRKHEDDFLRQSLEKYIAFAEREFFDTETGEVFDGIGKNREYIRLYNAPWMVTLFTEMYELTGDDKYLDYCFKSLELYYRGGGYKFYPNGFSMLLTYNAFKKAGRNAECDSIVGHFQKHVDTIVKTALSYPKHEANYEQTIVTPAVTFLSEFAMISGNAFYTAEAKKHIKVLERFNGHQPSCHLNETPIRYWDDFWFGEGRQQGDTFPHYWSCLTARSYTDYFMASGDEKYKAAAEECIRNCFCLFNEKGEGSCAYIYPYKLNGNKGEFYDQWANDQDFALYFYLTMTDGLKDR